jgi:hypothetical protein
MRGRAGEVRYPMSSEPREMLANWFVRRREDKGGAAENRTEKDLQVAVAADVVKRRPYSGSIRRAARSYGRREISQRVSH